MSLDTALAVPVIAPVELFKANPAPVKLLVVSEYATVSPSASEAATVKFALAPSATLPKLPAPVVQVGALSTLINPVDDVPDNPLEEVTLTL